MKNLLSKIFLIGFLTFSWSIVFSQSETDTINQEQIVVIKMENGEEYKGIISKLEDETIVLKTVNGEINLIAKNVISIENYDDFKSKNIHKNHYFLQNSAIPLPKRSAYLTVANLTILSAEYGLTDNWSIGGGVQLRGIFKSTPNWFLNAKYGVKLIPKLHFSTGILVGEMTAFSNVGYKVGLLHGKFTLGKEDSNLSLGFGTGYLNGEYIKVANSSIAISHNFKKTLFGTSWGIASENYFFPHYNLNFERAIEKVFAGVLGGKIYLKEASLGFGLTHSTTFSTTRKSKFAIGRYLSYSKSF